MAIVERLALLLEPLRFFKHAQERRDNRERELREHTLELLDTMLSRMEKRDEGNTQVMLEQIKATQAQMAALETWFQLFSNNATPDSLGTATVRPIDEYDAEQARERDRLLVLGYPVDKSPAEQLLWMETMGGIIP